MSTAIHLDDSLVAAATKLAIQSGRSVTEIVEEAVREKLANDRDKPSTESFRLVTFGGGGTLPGIDLSNNAMLADIMDGFRR